MKETFQSCPKAKTHSSRRLTYQIYHQLVYFKRKCFSFYQCVNNIVGVKQVSSCLPKILLTYTISWENITAFWVWLAFVVWRKTELQWIKNHDFWRANDHPQQWKQNAKSWSWYLEGNHPFFKVLSFLNRLLDPKYKLIIINKLPFMAIFVYKRLQRLRPRKLWRQQWSPATALSTAPTTTTTNTSSERPSKNCSQKEFVKGWKLEVAFYCYLELKFLIQHNFINIIWKV